MAPEYLQSAAQWKIPALPGSISWHSNRSFATMYNATTRAQQEIRRPWWETIEYHSALSSPQFANIEQGTEKFTRRVYCEACVCEHSNSPTAVVLFAKHSARFLGFADLRPPNTGPFTSTFQPLSSSYNTTVVLPLWANLFVLFVRSLKKWVVVEKMNSH